MMVASKIRQGMHACEACARLGRTQGCGQPARGARPSGEPTGMLYKIQQQRGPAPSLPPPSNLQGHEREPRDLDHLRVALRSADYDANQRKHPEEVHNQGENAAHSCSNLLGVPVARLRTIAAGVAEV